MRRDERLEFRLQSKKDKRAKIAVLALSFGLSVPPKVDLNVKTSGRKARRHPHSSGRDFGGGGAKGKQAAQRAGGHAFSAHNPYGKREKGDRRQFSY